MTGDSATFGTDSLALATPTTCCQADTTGETDTTNQPEGCCP